MHFGATLHLLRSHAGISLRALGSRVGVSAAYLSRIEHGHDPAPTGERALAIAEAMGIPGPVLLGLVDEIRGDAADWLRATPTGRRLAAELRRRELSEAQLARVLAFVLDEFRTSPGVARHDIRPLLHPSRVLLRVRIPRIEDAWTLAALRLADGDLARDVLQALRGGANGGTACVGAATAVSFVRAEAPRPRACLVVCEDALALATPDDRPVRVVWVLAGIEEGAMGAYHLAAAAKLADARLVDALLASKTGEEALGRVERFETLGSP